MQVPGGCRKRVQDPLEVAFQAIVNSEQCWEQNSGALSGCSFVYVCLCVHACGGLKQTVSSFRPFHFDLGSLAKPRAHECG